MENKQHNINNYTDVENILLINELILINHLKKNSRMKRFCVWLLNRAISNEIKKYGR